jgi:type II secretory pathway component PulF
MKSLPSYVGGLRPILDKLPPYNLYKDIQSGLFLVSLGTLMKSRVTFKDSLSFIEEEATPYLAEKIEEIVEKVDSGKDEGESMNTKFVGEIGYDIEDYAAGAGIEVAMSELGDEVVNDKIEKIKLSSAGLKTVAMILVFTFVLWSYGSFVSITQNMNVA